MLIDGEPVSPSTDALPLLDNLIVEHPMKKNFINRPASDNDFSSGETKQIDGDSSCPWL